MLLDVRIEIFSLYNRAAFLQGDVQATHRVSAVNSTLSRVPPQYVIASRAVDRTRARQGMGLFKTRGYVIRTLRTM